MTLPLITKDCMVATISKAIQEDPYKFATETMKQLMDEQPNLVAGTTSLLIPFIKAGEGDEIMRETILMAVWCVLGVSIKAVKAQVEAEEMNESWA